MNSDQIEELTKNMVNESKQIRKNALQMAWHMRGGATYSDVLTMSQDEVSDLNDIIDDHMETTKKSGVPFF
jgi:uncharacterized protein YukE